VDFYMQSTCMYRHYSTELGVAFK